MLTNPVDPRFIPAGAGNTASLNKCVRSITVHPRRRGEHYGHYIIAALSVGSSPQARGTLRYYAVMGVSIRFIPAGAGNTADKKSGIDERAVHPRRRGEHRISTNWLPSPNGSSPQARGTHCGCRRTGRIPRFIPAGAGNTVALCISADLRAVHPRRRGEHTVSNLASAAIDGSSPQARGTPHSSIIQRLYWRFIPAGAGNTPCGYHHDARMSVHPRRRGEHHHWHRRRRPTAGSSPQARGTRKFPVQTIHKQRFIPAGAGNTISSRFDA